ncbi:MAG: hypothetical protein HC771_03035 [Synechococcales cyanobacterium CRU_2_2]|nr:hypothetical protein [Synechococcales cyanobacterium CRU_2_2]
MEAAYGPGLLPCITAGQIQSRAQLSRGQLTRACSSGEAKPLNGDRPIDPLSDELLGIIPPSDSQQIEWLCQFAQLNLIPLFHEVVGEVVYRFTSKHGDIRVTPIPDKINRRVITDVRRHCGSLDAGLLEWLEAPLLIPGTPTRRNQILTLPGFPLDGWQVRSLRSDRNTLAWLHTEAQENYASSQVTPSQMVASGLICRPARGYTASLGHRHGYEALIEAYRRLLACWDYCDRFKFVCRVML